ncbi:potassium-transporting ATPase subunit KdpA [Corynebacterium sp. Marseille-Q2823]|uniref:potassium-transporting ATPase subunit KdpA n=1 Tax=Corynebacterium sp. Marseille-Q2823 TaxID=2736606 RepID=UPI0020CA96D7|nr:potassium-transporting ATPase subunit KdpA [Corynebacterium sp. Marseille-Q2823]
MIASIVAVAPQYLALFALLAAAYVPLGNWMARTYTSEKDWAVERLIYRILRVDPNRGHNAKNYTRALLGFSLASVLVLYAVQRLQAVLPSFGNAREDAVEPWMAFNTAASFTGSSGFGVRSGVK